MSGIATDPLQEAIDARLSGDATLTVTLGARIYDDTPDGEPYPYVVIADFTEAPNDTMGTTGRDLTVTLHVWSRFRGFRECNRIANRIDQLLDRWLPTVAGWHTTAMLHEFYETLRDPDGITRHGVLRYRIHVHQ